MMEYLVETLCQELGIKQCTQQTRSLPGIWSGQDGRQLRKKQFRVCIGGLDSPERVSFKLRF